MCGICGFWSATHREDGAREEVLQGMVDTLAHRGPDDQGIVLRTGSGKVVGLGHRRLSIIDLSRAGRQPMSDSKEEVFLVFNGEIYNFPELRRNLEKRGRSFVSNSDTEVILQAYLEYGLEVFEKLDGMFALALWDERVRRLILARDPFGKKPLFYYRDGSQWLFASELKSLMKHPLFQKRLDPGSVETYLFFGYLPSPRSIFLNVGKVKPGHYMVIEEDQCRETPYWKISFRTDSTPPTMEEAKERFLELFRRAVAKRLISDVPLGVLLSGGLDSTAVAAFARQVSPKPLTTFTMGFEEEAFNELPFAAEAADYLGMQNIHMVARRKELVDTVERLPEIADEPLADSSIIPFYLLSRMTRQHVTVALGGDGADELMAGYPTYPLHRYMNIYETFPAVLKRLMAAAVKLVPPTYSNYNIEYGVKKFLQGSGYPPEICHYIWMAYCALEDLEGVLGNRALSTEQLFGGIRDKLSESDCVTDEEKMLYLDMRVYLPDSILAKVDRASMSWALEVRAPFLDKSLAEFCITLPADMKLEGIRGKKILRQAVKGLVPDSIITRQKKGFTPPVARWINTDLQDMVNDFLGFRSLERSGIFQADYVRRLLEDHRRGKRDNWRQIWVLLVFQMWHHRYM
jgi:asparagine synthase (glutamine-hydrolysing)